MQSNTFIGSGEAVVRRLLLTEGSPVVIPTNCVRLHSEVVSNKDGVEVLELWLAAPAFKAADYSTPALGGEKTIYNNTVVHDDDKAFSKYDIEETVNKNLESYRTDDDDWDD